MKYISLGRDHQNSNAASVDVLDSHVESLFPSRQDRNLPMPAAFMAEVLSDSLLSRL